MGGRETRPLSTYNISEIAEWVVSRQYDAAYLDPATGEVYPSFEGMGPLDEDGERVDLDDTDWVPIGGAGSQAAYRDMEVFADAVADPLVRRQLQGALGGRGVFRRFRDVMWHQPEEVDRAWSAYRELGAELRALEWLVDEGLVSDEDTRKARATRQAAQRALLDTVGGTTRARLILLVTEPPEVAGPYARGLQEVALLTRASEVVCPRDDVAGSYERFLAVLADES